MKQFWKILTQNIHKLEAKIKKKKLRPNKKYLKQILVWRVCNLELSLL